MLFTHLIELVSHPSYSYNSHRLSPQVIMRASFKSSFFYAINLLCVELIVNVPRGTG
jgi:hypothetical protein